MGTVAEEKETMIQKGLSEWWSEETEYVFQRIERWAAFARGYNRLRSQRWPKNRQMSQDSWNVSSDKTACASQFYNFKRSKRKSCPEETKINRYNTFNYQSNSKLDSNCLEMYWYDHSIYFKTIGDIRSSKKDVKDQGKVSRNSGELFEWNADSFTDSISEKIRDNDRPYDPNSLNIVAEQKGNRATQNAWPIVDLSKLDLNLMSDQRRDE